ncbi:LLM class flavin-dependent oxidoreductase [Nocardia sp. NPDC059246]|uniref:LLM class flavin-dependent oxidoreductase n=1 Tax=unclassified Nocardia TaxID=2637762 RepID=UPI0036C801A4
MESVGNRNQKGTIVTVTRSRLGVSLPMLNQPYTKLSELAALADEAGFDSVWDYEFFRNPFIAHALNARATENVKLGTGLATAISRTPFEMANAVADVDELSCGRAILGLSTGAASWTDAFNGGDVSHALPRMREYIEILRLVWRHFTDGEPAHYQGQFYNFETPLINPWGVRELERPDIPIYLGCLKERMLQMAGEVADGVLTYFVTPEFITGHVLPNITKGAEKSGRNPAEVDVTALVLCSVSSDRKEAIRRARINVGNYAAFPVSATPIEFMGLTEDRDYVVKKLFEEGPAALETAVSDELVRRFSIVGTPDEACEQLAEYDGVLPHIVLHTPYVPPIAQADSEDAFRTMVRTFAR